MNLEEYKNKRAALLDEAQQLLDNGKIQEAKAKNGEVEALDAEYEKDRTDKANAALLDEQAKPIPQIILDNSKELGEENNKMPQYNAESREYKNAWLKELAKDANTKAYTLGAPTAEEKNAYTITTANSGDIVPVEVQNNIVELVESMAPMYDDATKTRLTKGFSIPRHTGITAGDAKVTAEGVANDDEENTFDSLDLTGVEIKKHVVITRKMQFQSIDAFQTWVEHELAERIANAKEVRIQSQLSNTTYGIAAANVLTAQTYTDANIRKIFALIRAQGVKTIYANSNTIWTGIFGIADTTGRPVFIPNQTDDPVVRGSVYGAVVKDDENIADNVAYFGVPAEILANDFDPMAMSNFLDPKTFETTLGAYSLFDAGLKKPLAFVKVTFKVGE